MEEVKFISKESLLFIRFLKDTNQYIDFRCKVNGLYRNKGIKNKILRLFTKNDFDIIVAWFCNYIQQNIRLMREDFSKYKKRKNKKIL